MKLTEKQIKDIEKLTRLKYGNYKNRSQGFSNGTFAMPSSINLEIFDMGVLYYKAEDADYYDNGTPIPIEGLQPLGKILKGEQNDK